MSNPGVTSNYVTTQPGAWQQPGTNHVGNGGNATPNTVIVVQPGGCPQCKQGVMVNDFTCCGICLGVCFFPIGILCCFAMREYQCQNCGYTQ